MNKVLVCTIACVASVFLTLTIGVSAAFAEGGFSSSMTAVYTGFNSRIWNDKNSDSWSTQVSLQNCASHNLHWKYDPTIQLTRERGGLFPSESKGWRTYNCFNRNDLQDWGRQTDAGNYRFALMRLNGEERTVDSFDSQIVRVSY